VNFNLIVVGDFPTPEFSSWAPRKCDATAFLGDIPAGERLKAFYLGQHPVTDPAHPRSVEFPLGMSKNELFPQLSSEYTDPATGVLYTVPCYIPATEADTKDTTVCPFPFVRPIGDDHPRNCIQPCPVPAYSDDQYTQMWVLSSAVAVAGLILNLFLVATWVLSGRKQFGRTRFQLRSCVAGGLVYALVRLIILSGFC
jgi:hypothetical protein